jgi:hypothetical protein
MITINEDKLEFNFAFDAIKLDDSNFYRKHFMKIQDNLKIIDILAIDKNRNYFIEIKDYTYPETKSIKRIELIETIVKKVICSLSILYPMSYKAHKPYEKEIAKKFFQKQNLTIILHIEKPILTMRIEQSTWDLSELQQKLKQKLKAISNSVKVVSINNMQNLPWKVTVKNNQ